MTEVSMIQIPTFASPEIQRLWAEGSEGGPLLVRPFAAPLWSGLGRIMLHTGDVLTPHIVRVEPREWEIAWLDAEATPTAVQRLTLWNQGENAVVLKEIVEATRDVTLAANEGFRFGILNDRANRFTRAVRDQRGKVHTVSMSLGQPRTVGLGHIVTLEGRVKFEADQEMVYVSPGERTAPAEGSSEGAWGPQIDWVFVRAGTGHYCADDTIRQSMIRLEALDEQAGA